jgi:hypothetical protein
MTSHIILPDEVHDVFLEILVDSELAMIFLSIHPVGSFDVRLTFEDNDESTDTDLNMGLTINDVTYFSYP